MGGESVTVFYCIQATLNAGRRSEIKADWITRTHYPNFVISFKSRAEIPPGPHKAPTLTLPDDEQWRLNHRLTFPSPWPLCSYRFSTDSITRWCVHSFPWSVTHCEFLPKQLLGLDIYLLHLHLLVKTAWLAVSWWLPFLMIHSSMVWMSSWTVIQKMEPFPWRMRMNCSSRYWLIDFAAVGLGTRQINVLFSPFFAVVLGNNNHKCQENQ